MSSKIINAFSMLGLDIMKHLEILIYCSTSSKSQSLTRIFVSLKMNSSLWYVLFCGNVGQMIMILSKISLCRNSFNVQFIISFSHNYFVRQLSFETAPLKLATTLFSGPSFCLFSSPSLCFRV